MHLGSAGCTWTHRCSFGALVTVIPALLAVALGVGGDCWPTPPRPDDQRALVVFGVGFAMYASIRRYRVLAATDAESAGGPLVSDQPAVAMAIQAMATSLGHQSLPFLQ